MAIGNSLGLAWYLIHEPEVVMHTPSKDDDLMQRWRKSTAREKSAVIKAFLDECGEDATWEQWLAFLHRKQQVKGFEWTKLVD